MALVLDDLPPEKEELAFHWKSGRLCLDFVATVGERWRRCFERLRTPEDLERWAAEAGFFGTPLAASTFDLEAARELREAVNRLARPGLAQWRGDRRLLNTWAARPAPAPQLTPQGKLVWTALRPIEATISGVGRDAVELLSGPLAGRIRECAAEDCALLFVDASRPGRRRWCASEACGNRERTKAYRRRRLEEPR